MKRFVVLLSLLLAAHCSLLTAHEAASEPTVVPITTDPTPAVETEAESPQASLRRMSRADRRLAREVVRDAAEAAGMRRLEFMRAVVDEDQDAVDELKLSLALHDNALGFDPDEFGQFLAMILEFIEMLMAMFSMFADVSPAGPWCVNVGYQMAA
jgi:hypothetical protein